MFDWVRQKYRGVDVPAIVEYTLENCEPLIKKLEIWIPISHLYIESPFRFGSIVFRAITKKMLDDWKESWLAHAKTPEEIDGVNVGIESRRKRIQALAAATITIEAEPERAYERAFEEIDKAISLLRFFSPTNFRPRQVCHSAPLGTQHEDEYVYLLVDTGKISNYASGFTYKASPIWNLSNHDLNTCSRELNILSVLLQKEKLTDFQNAVLNALILYSRTSLAKDISDKLVYMLVALESIFLKDRSEQIVDNISLRMSFMQDVSVPGRREIISNVKKAYKLRSTYIHHGQSITTFLISVSAFDNSIGTGGAWVFLCMPASSPIAPALLAVWVNRFIFLFVPRNQAWVDSSFDLLKPAGAIFLGPMSNADRVSRC